MDNSEMIDVLLIEDNPGDARLTQVELSDARFIGWDLPRFDIAWVETLAEGLAHLDAAAAGEVHPIDAVLTDLDLPDSQAGDTFAVLRERFPHLPIVVLTGREDPELARASVRAGAQDYLFKNEVTGSLLAHALMYAIERQQIKGALEDAHCTLEQRVEVRTAELREANQALQAEVAARQRTEGKLKESVALLQATLDATGDSIIAVGKDGRAVTYNRSMEALFDMPQGWFEEPSLAARMDQAKSQLKHPDEAFARIQALYDDWELEHRDLLEFKDGRVYERYTAPYYIEGEVGGRVWSFRDITARRQAKHALRESERRLQAIMQYTPVIIYMKDTEGRFVVVNRAFEEAFAITQAEIMGKTSYDLIPEAMAAAHQAHDERVMRAGEPLEFEEHGVQADGEKYTVISIKFPIYDAAGDVCGVGGISTDITARKRMEAALRESEARFKMTIQRAPIGVGMVDSEGNLIDCNATLAAMVGYSCEELLRLNFADFTHPDDLEREWQLINQLWDAEMTEYRMEKRYIHKNGHTIWVDVAASLFKDEMGKLAFGFAFVRDITERKRAAQALRESNEKLTLLFDSLPVGVSVLDQDRNVVKQNQALGQILAMSEEGLARGDYRHRRYLCADGAPMPPEEFPSTRVLNGEEAVYNTEIGVVKEDGDLVWTNVSAVGCALADWRVVIVTSDITERKQAEESLRESQALLARAETLARLGSWEWDLEEDVFTLSEGWLRVHGCQQGQLSRKHLLTIAHPDDRQRVKDAFERALAYGEPYDLEHRIIRQDNGEVRVVRAYGEVVYDGETPVRMYGVAQDITEQKRAQEALERVRYSIDRVTDSVLWVDKDGNFIDVNDAACDNLGYTREELLTMGVPDIDPNFPHEVWSAHWEEMVKCGTMTLESVHQTKGGGQFPVEVIIHNQQFGDTRYNCVLVRDITERKREEENLRRYQNIVSSTPDGIAFLDEDYRYLIINDAYERFSGTKREQFIGLTVAEYLGEDVFQRDVKPHFDRCLQGETITYQEWFDYPALGRRFVEITYFPYRDVYNRITGIVSSTRDITERKRAEEALRENEAFLQTVYDHSPVGIYVVDVMGEGEYVYRGVNPAHEKILGVANDLIQGKSPYFLAQDYGEEVVDYILDLYNTCVQQRQPLELEENVLWEGKRVSLLTQITPLMDEHDRVYRLIGTILDITARKQAEEALQESEEKYRRLVEGAPSILYIYSDQRGALYWSQRVQEVLGYAPTDLVEAPYLWHDAIHPDDIAVVDEAIAASMKGSGFDIAYRIQDIDGNWHWFRDRFIGKRQVGDERIIEGLATDITERKRAEQALHKTTERLQIEHEIDTAILAAQSSEEIVRAALTHLHHLIPCPRASISVIDSTQQQGRDMLVLVDGELQAKGTAWHPLAGAGERLAEAIQRGHPYIVQDIAALETLTPLEQALQASGMRAYVSVPLLGQDAPVGTLNMASETPDFFQSDHVEILQEVAASLAVALQQARLLEQTRQDADTKALLLREVNHRVKNNLDAIIGLLYVERRHAPPEARAAFQPIVDDLNQRIMGLAKVHHMLSAAEWQPLVLSELAEQLIHTAIRNSLHDAEIIVDVAPSPVRVSPGQAHHLALVISELTTNTLKHGVAGRRAVRIRAQILQQDDTITLIYRNDGPDYPEDVLQMSRHGAGLDIVKKIVRKNLLGELVLRNDGGAVTEIRFRARQEI